MLKFSTHNEFIIPRGSIIHNTNSTNWLYKNEKFSLLGYILHHYFDVSTEKLDGEVFIGNLSNRTGEEYKGFSRYNDKENKHEAEPWVHLYYTYNNIDSQMMCISKYTEYKCYYERIETNIEL